MCGCATHQTDKAGQTPEAAPGVVSLRVEDMACGHCAGTITKAIENALPGALVDANPVSMLVSIHGSSDLDAIKSIVAGAGYTPTDTAVA